MKQSHAHRALLVVGVALLYAATARLGLLLDAVGGFASLVWAPTGIAMAAAVLLGRVALAGVFAGALVANALTGASLAAASAIALGNTLEAAAAAWALRRLHFDPSIGRLRDAFLLLGASAIAPLVSATIGVSSLLAAATIRSPEAWAAWQAWWLGDFVGALLVAPLILVWASPRNDHPGRRTRVEITALTLTLPVLAGVVFFADGLRSASILQAYLVFPLLLWAAVRFQQRGATLAVFVTALIALLGTAQQVGPFAQAELHSGLFALQTFMGIVAITFLLLSVAMAERARALQALRVAVGDDTSPTLSGSAGPLYRLLVESVMDYAIFALDSAGRVLSWNRGAERLKGYTAHEIIGKHFSIFYPDDVVKTGFPDHELEVAGRVGRFEDEGWRVRKDGTLFWANVVITALRDGKGTVVGFSKVTRDLTARREAEENSRRLAAAEAASAEARRSGDDASFLAEASEVLASSLDYQLTFNQLAHLMVPRLGDWCVIDTRTEAGGLRRVAVAHKDPARQAFAHQVEAEYPTDMAATTGVPNVFRTGQAELYPETTAEMVAAGARDDRHAAILRELDIRSVIIVPIKARDRVDGVLTLVSAESGRRYNSADLELAKELGRRAGLALENALLLHEAQAAGQRNARLQEVTSRLAGVVTQDDVGDTVLQVGIAALGAVHAVLSVLSPEGDELEIVSSVGLPDDALRHFKRFRVDAALPMSQAVRDGAPLFLQDRGEIVARFPDLREANSRATTEAWIALPLALGERMLGGVAFGFAEARRFDHNDRAFAEALAFQAAQALERTRLYAAEQGARAEAEIANRAKSDFLATMSHELRTPLNAIGGYAELLEMGIHGSLTPPQSEAVERIRRSERRLRSLIEDVLDFARIEAGKVELSLDTVPIRETIADLETIVLPQLRAKELAFSVVNCDGSLAARADPQKVQQILLNLLTNAIKFTPENGRITVEGAVSGDQVEVRISDSGVGIPEDQLGAIFEPFVQIGRSLTRPQEGSGLGLAISRDLARAMHGDLRVESAVGAGSSFILALPAAASDRKTDAPPST